MIHHIVQFSLRQKPIVLFLVAFMAVVGAIAFHNMPVDAYPDLSPPMVEVISQWPGHAAEEVERLVPQREAAQRADDRDGHREHHDERFHE